MAPTCCIECGRVLHAATDPICADCAGELAWWRMLDGCPRCGWDSSLEPRIWPGPDDSSLGTRPEGFNPTCPGCYSGGTALHACHALLRYEGRAKQWIPGFKHARTPFGPGPASTLAIEFLATELARRLRRRGVPRPDLILPIPLHPNRRRKRGFNQGEFIGRRLAAVLDLRCDDRTLIRTRNTAPQAHLGVAARRANLRGAFGIRQDPGYHGRRHRKRPSVCDLERVWLVDDVLTTGATLEAAAATLLDAGVGEVHGLTLAATPPRRPGRAKIERHPYHALRSSAPARVEPRPGPRS